MGTVVTLDLYDDEPPSVLTLTPIVEEAIEVLHVADEMFSTWKETSCISRLRRGDLSLDEAPDDVKRVLELCEEARRVTHGWFDPWAMPGGVDPTGLVKGWAAQRCLDVLQRGNLGGAIVNAAGDIASFGGPKLGEPFRVGVVDPFDTRRLAYVV
ncbi:MAG TPA: FAD:protein FMN transferase, partial [Acidimicrobiales bacterium]|nr:FAD:protein FMN transferase [Acidimicrobiales bacterium]